MSHTMPTISTTYNYINQETLTTRLTHNNITHLSLNSTTNNHINIYNINNMNVLTRTRVQCTSSTGALTYNIKLIIACLNTNGYANNIDYINFMAMHTDILFLSETHHSKHLEIEQAIHVTNKRVRSKTGLRISKRGHLPGGLSFIINSELSFTCRFISRRIGLMTINKLAIIGVYLPSRGDNDSERLMEYESEIETISTTISELSAKKFELLLIGDFNADFNRLDSRLKLLKSMLDKHNLVSCESPNYHIRHTFKKKNADGFNSSKIDFMFKKSGSRLTQELKNVDDAENQSDHTALMTDVNLECSTEFKATHIKETDLKPLSIKWDDPEQVEMYKSKLTRQLDMLEYEVKVFKEMIDKKAIVQKTTQLLTSVGHAITEATLLTKNYFAKTKPKQRCFRKYNSWWDDECHRLFEIVKIVYVKYRATDFNCEALKSELREAKRTLEIKNALISQ